MEGSEGECVRIKCAEEEQRAEYRRGSTEWNPSQALQLEAPQWHTHYSTSVTGGMDYFVVLKVDLSFRL
jgi:hypothetical protein